MAARFRRWKGTVQARFDQPERELLAGLFASLAELIADADPGTATASADPLEALVAPAAGDALPADPVLARLFPDGYADPTEAAEFRRYTEGELRAGKLANLRCVVETISAASGRIVLDPAQAEAWLGALNDLRLALGARLNVTEDLLAEPWQFAGDAQVAAQLQVFEWLGYLQETLVRSLANLGG